MNTFQSRSQAAMRGFMLLLVVMLAFQSFGMHALAAPAARPGDLQQGGNAPALTCGCVSTNIEAVLLIDDSGSMQANDPRERRKDLARISVEKMAAIQGDPGLRVRNVQVQVVRFSGKKIEKSGWIQADPAGDWKTAFAKITPAVSDTPTTEFSGPFGEAKDLFTETNCTHRLILFFTDGTPEDQAGLYKDEKLAREFETLSSLAQDIRGLDGIYIIGFKARGNYLDNGIQTRWFDLVKNLSDFGGKGLTSEDNIPRIVFIPSQILENIWFREKPEAAQAAGAKIDFAELTKYQDLWVKFDGEPVQLQQGQQSRLKFKLVNAAGSAAMPGGDLAKILGPARDSAPTPEWKVSITPPGQDTALPVTLAGDSYQFNWTPQSSGMNQLKVEYSLLDGGKALLNCSGIATLEVDPIPPVAFGLLFGPPGEPDHNSITIPVLLNYAGDRSSLTWSLHAKAIDTRTNRPLNAVPYPDSKDASRMDLVIDPIEDAGEIRISMGAEVQAGGQTFIIDNPPFTIHIPSSSLPCQCDGSWQTWFWPLALLLALLLIALLVLRFAVGGARNQDRDQKQDGSRLRAWPVLFLPLSVLLVLLVLNRLLWCCVIPPWLFLVGLLILILLFLGLTLFSGNNTGRRQPPPDRRDDDTPSPTPGQPHPDRSGPNPVAASGSPRDEQTVGMPGEASGSQASPTVVPVADLSHDRPDGDLDLPGDHPPGAEGVPMPVVPPDPSHQDPSDPVPDPARDEKRDAVPIPVPIPTPGPGPIVVPVPIPGPIPVPVPVPFPVPVPTPPVPLPPGPHPEPPPSDSKPEESDQEEKEEKKEAARDPLALIEGIDKAVEELLYARGIYTFKQLAATDSSTIQAWLDEQSWEMMDPATWPKQARLAEIAQESQNPMDRELYKDYMDYLKGGRIPERKKKPTALRQAHHEKDDLTLIEGIGPEAAECLYREKINTYRKLANTEVGKLISLVKEQGWQNIMDPETWPKQAELAAIAAESGRQEDADVFHAYKNYLKGGRRPESEGSP